MSGIGCRGPDRRFDLVHVVRWIWQPECSFVMAVAVYHHRLVHTCALQTQQHAYFNRRYPAALYLLRGRSRYAVRAADVYLYGQPPGHQVR